MKQIVLFCMCFFSTFVFAQTGNIGVGTTTPNANAILDIKATNKGVLLPRMDSVARKAIPNTKGLLVYDTTYSNFYFNTGTSWQKISGISAIANGSNPGDMLYWNGSSWTTTPAGKPGQYLQFDTTLKPIWTGDQYPAITTLAVTNITDSSVVFNVNLIRSGVSANATNYGEYDFEKGIVWSTSPNPVYNSSYSYYGTTNYFYDTTTAPGTYAYSTSDNQQYLYMNTTYYARAYAYNNSGIVYGTQISFKTLTGPVSIPHIQTYSYSQTADSVTLYGNVIYGGGVPVTTGGFTISLSSDLSNSVTIPATVTNNSFSASIATTGLAHGYTYYYAAFATNSAGTGYGSINSFYY